MEKAYPRINKNLILISIGFGAFFYLVEIYIMGTKNNFFLIPLIIFLILINIFYRDILKFSGMDINGPMSFLGIQNSIEDILLPGENIIKTYDKGLKVIIRFGFIPTRLLSSQKYIFTNFRIIARLGIFSDVRSYFYNKPKNVRYNKLIFCSNFTINKYWKTKNKFCFNLIYILVNFRIKTDDKDEMYDIVDKYKKQT